MRNERSCQPAPFGSRAGFAGVLLDGGFANTLNLPMNAKEKLAGADVGQVESMLARNYTPVTTLRIRTGVQLRRGSTAELRTATPLGDVSVALKPPADDPADTPMLKNGDTIGLDSTAAATTVEFGAGLGGDPGQPRSRAQLHQHHQRFRRGDR